MHLPSYAFPILGFALGDAIAVVDVVADAISHVLLHRADIDEASVAACLGNALPHIFVIVAVGQERRLT